MGAMCITSASFCVALCKQVCVPTHKGDSLYARALGRMCAVVLKRCLCEAVINIIQVLSLAEPLF